MPETDEREPMSEVESAHAALWGLRSRTPPAWLDAVRSNFSAFLEDHAACERKASATAMTLAAHYRDKTELVTAMVELACEELEHFRRVYEIIVRRGGSLAADSRDMYVGKLLALVRRGPDFYLLDRLLVAGVVEARGCERFRLLAEGLDSDLAPFYLDFARGEARHAALFVRLAKIYFSADLVHRSLDQLLASEAEIVASLPLRPALH
jgi:tRNA 2-(methylsulfanyl)-N6-isopentenyladenosine37 hydroxylase